MIMRVCWCFLMWLCVTAALRHRFICHCLDVGETDGQGGRGSGCRDYKFVIYLYFVHFLAFLVFSGIYSVVLYFHFSLFSYFLLSYISLICLYFVVIYVYLIITLFYRSISLIFTHFFNSFYLIFPSFSHLTPFMFLLFSGSLSRSFPLFVLICSCVLFHTLLSLLPFSFPYFYTRHFIVFSVPFLLGASDFHSLFFISRLSFAHPLPLFFSWHVSFPLFFVSFSLFFFHSISA